MAQVWLAGVTFLGAALLQKGRKGNQRVKKTEPAQVRLAYETTTVCTLILSDTRLCRSHMRRSRHRACCAVSQVPDSSPDDDDQRSERNPQASTPLPAERTRETASTSGDPTLDPRPLASQPAFATDGDGVASNSSVPASREASTAANKEPGGSGGGGDAATSAFIVFSSMHEHVPITGSDMPVPLSRPCANSVLSSAGSLAESLGAPATLQPANSTEEVLSQISGRLPIPPPSQPLPSQPLPSPLSSVAERQPSNGASDSLPRQSSGSRQQEQPLIDLPIDGQQQRQQADSKPQPPTSPQQSAEQEWGWDQQETAPALAASPQELATAAAADLLKRKSAEYSAAKAFAALADPAGSQAPPSSRKQTSDEHRRGEVAQLSSYGWMATGGAAAPDQTIAEAEAADAAGREQFQHATGPGGSGQMTQRSKGYSGGAGDISGNSAPPEQRRGSADGLEGAMKRMSRDSDR